MIRPPSSDMEAALKAVEQITGEPVIAAAFPRNFDPHANSVAWLAYRYPQQYRLIKGITPADNILVDLRDKHSWVFESEVDAVRDHYAREADKLERKKAND